MTRMPSQQSRTERLVEFGLPTLIFVAVFVSRWAKFVEPDFFMHLRVGQWIVENRSVPRTDVFSHVAQGLPWTDHEWLFQVLLYFLHRLGGWELLAVVRCSLLGLSYLFTWRTCRLLGLGRTMSMAMTLLAASMAMGSVEFRPQVITYVLFPLYFEIMLRYLRGEAAPVWLLPVLIVPWANMHGAFVAVFVLAGIMLGAEFLKHLAHRMGHPLPGDLVSLERLGKLTGVMLVAFAATAINPYGTEMWLFPFKVVQHPIFFQMIFEWMPPEFPFFTPFWVVLGLYIALAIPAWHFTDFRNTLLLVLWSYFSLSARRNIVLFGYVAAPIFGQFLLQAWEGLLARYASGWRNLWFVQRFPVGAIALYCAYTVWIVGETLVQQTVHEFGVGIHSDVPAPTADFILRERPAGNMFNEYNVGGYLIYRLFPHYKVYQDGRVDVYGPKLFYTYKVIESGHSLWRRAEKAQDLNLFVLTYGGVKHRGNLASQLDDDPQWSLVHFDDACIVYVRNTGPNRELAARKGYKYIKPGYSPDEYLKTADLQTSALLEVERALAEVPNFRYGRTLKVFLLSALGRFDEAETVTEELVRLSKNSSQAWLARGKVAMFLHKYEEAAQYYRRAIELAPRQVEAWQLLGSVLEAAHRDQEALDAYIQGARYCGPREIDVFISVARVASRLGKENLAERYWNKYLEMDPSNIVALNDAGTLYLRRKDYRRAIALFERATEIDPKNAAPYYNLACAYAALQDRSRALTYLRQALSRGGATVAAIAEKDADLASLRSLPEFGALVRPTTTTAEAQSTSTSISGTESQHEGR